MNFFAYKALIKLQNDKNRYMNKGKVCVCRWLWGGGG